MSEAQSAQTAAAEVTQQEQPVGLLDKIILENRIGRDDEQKKRSQQEIKTLLQEAQEGTLLVSKDVESAIIARIANIDAALSLQLNAIMHTPEFQKLEASWRGLHYLVSKSETGRMLKIKVLNATKDTLLSDLGEGVLAFERSALFRKVYTEEYGMFGGAPYGALIGDYEFGRHPQDMALLEKISRVAAAAHAPFLAAAQPQLFNLDSFTEIGRPSDLAKIFDSVEYAKWDSFRKSEDSRYVGLALPHILMRMPYGPDTTPVKAFNFQEDVDGTNHSKYLWGNAAYALGPGSLTPLRSTSGVPLSVVSRAEAWWRACRRIRSGPMRGMWHSSVPPRLPSTIDGKRSSRTWGLSHYCTVKGRTMRHSSASIPVRRPPNMTRTLPMPMRICRSSCPTSWPPRALRIISRR